MDRSELLGRVSDAVPDPSADEVAIIEAAMEGRDLAFPVMTDVRSTLLRWMCTDSSTRSLIDPRGLRVENARIAGTLDLRNIDIEFLLRLHNCIVDGDIVLADARLRSIGFNGTICQKLVCDRAVVAGAVFLRKDKLGPFKSTGVSFADASVSGLIVADGAEIGPTDDEYAALNMHRSKIRGYVNLKGAKIHGSLYAEDIEVGGIDGSGMKVTANPLKENSAAIEIIRGAVTGWVALGLSNAAATEISGSVIMTGCVVGGGVNFTNTHVMPSRIGQESGSAENDADSGDLKPIPLASKVKTDREFPILVGLHLMRIGIHLLLHDMTVRDGRIAIEDSDIGKNLNCSGLFVGHSTEDHSGDKKRANSAESEEFISKPYRISPEERLPDIAILSTNIGGTLFWKPTLPGKNSTVFLGRTSAERLDITNTAYWPHRGHLRLDGLRYQYIEGDIEFARTRLAGFARWIRKNRWSRPWSFAQHTFLRLANAVGGADSAYLRWLRLYTSRYFDPQAYDTLAAALRVMGRPNDATRVLIAKADDRRRAQGVMATLLGLPYRFLVGNGFRTWWAAVWIILVTLIGTVVFNNAYQHGELRQVKPAGQVMPFQPFVYSLDVLLPIINLGEANSYIVASPQANAVRVYFWVQTGIGWILATALAASAGAALQRRQP
jgi:hypothetical protein